MNRRNNLICIGAAVSMLLLTLDGQTAISGAQNGIQLCIQNLIPSLFPFLVVSNILTGNLAGIHSRFTRLIGKLYHVPEGSESILLTGIMGGYPVGGQCVSDAYKTGTISRVQANRMLMFCNQAGPSFIFGILAGQFPSISYAWALWGIQILSAFLTANTVNKYNNESVSIHPKVNPSITDIIKKSVSTMAIICGWVIVFRVIISFADHWFLWIVPENVRIILYGILELTNGCVNLHMIENVGVRFVVCAAILSFGGLCVTMQTLSVIGTLQQRTYLSGKLLQTLYAVLLSCLILPVELNARKFFPSNAARILIVIAMAAIFTRKKKKRSSMQAQIGV